MYTTPYTPPTPAQRAAQQRAAQQRRTWRRVWATLAAVAVLALGYLVGAAMAGNGPFAPAPPTTNVWQYGA